MNLMKIMIPKNNSKLSTIPNTRHATTLAYSLRKVQKSFKDFQFDRNSIALKDQSNYGNYAEDETMQNLWRQIEQHLKIKRLKSTKTFKLNLRKCKHIYDKSIETISFGVHRQFSDLQELSLDFTDCTRLSKRTLHHVSQHMIKLSPHLKVLRLNLTSCGAISSQEFAKSIRHITKSSPFLENFSLGLRNTRVSNEDSGSILSSFRYLKRLRKLDLNFSDCHELDDSGVVQISSKAFKMSSLQRLRLDFERSTAFPSRHYPSDIALMQLASRIRKSSITNLRTLSFVFGNSSGIGREGIQKLVDAITEKFVFLEGLTLKFEACRDIPGNVLEGIGSKISISSEHLKKLSLTFPQSETAIREKEKILKKLDFIPETIIYLS